MNSLSRCLLSLVLFVPIITNAQDQAERARRAATEETLKRFGLTEELLTKLKQKGVDVRTSLRGYKYWDEKVRAALSDCVITGRVDSIIKMPAPKTDPFRSKARIIVTEVLKGEKKDLKTVEILLESGPLLKSGNGSIIVFPEPRFRVGEEVLLFVHYPEKDSYLTTVYRSYFQRHGLHLQSNAFVVDELSKFTIKNNSVLYYGIDRPISRVVEGVKEIDSLLIK